MNDDAIEQHWLPEEEEFLATVDDSKKGVSVLQTGTKYTNDYWMQFGQGYGCVLPGRNGSK